MKKTKNYVLLMLVSIITACAPNALKTMQAELAYPISSALGEGAFWNYKTQELLWIDIEKQHLYVYNPKLNTNKKIQIEVIVNFLNMLSL